MFGVLTLAMFEALVMRNVDEFHSWLDAQKLFGGQDDAVVRVRDNRDGESAPSPGKSGSGGAEGTR